MNKWFVEKKTFIFLKLSNWKTFCFDTETQISFWRKKTSNDTKSHKWVICCLRLYEWTCSNTHVTMAFPGTHTPWINENMCAAFMSVSWEISCLCVSACRCLLRSVRRQSWRECWRSCGNWWWTQWKKQLCFQHLLTRRYVIHSLLFPSPFSSFLLLNFSAFLCCAPLWLYINPSILPLPHSLSLPSFLRLL